MLFITLPGSLILFVFRQHQSRDLENYITNIKGGRVILIFLYFTAFSIIINEIAIVDSENSKINSIQELEEKIFKIDERPKFGFEIVDSANSTRTTFGKGEMIFVGVK